MSDTKASEPVTLVKSEDQYIGLTPGELSYLVRHSFRDRSFEFKEPYPRELEEFGGTVAEVIEVAKETGWITPISPQAIVIRWAKVDDLKAALLEQGLPIRGKKAELLATCLTHCPNWVERFAATRPGYEMTDKGRIELQATRPEFVPQTKETHMQQMRVYFERDLNDARQSPSILGIKIWPRDDGFWATDPCPRAAGFSGVFLPDEVPELYPDDCPDEDACCCVNRMMVLRDDTSPEAEILRQKMIQRGMTPPPQRADVRPLTETEQDETIKKAQQALETGPEKDKSLWRFVLGLFSKKS